MNVIVVGGGKVGAYLASILLDGGHTVKIIEARHEHILLLLKDFASTQLVEGNGTDPTILETAGIQNANVVAAVTGNDETNLVIATLARAEFNVPRIIARVNSPKNAWMFTHEMGVDVALNQADLMAHLIVEEMSLGEMMTLLKLRKGQYSLVEEKVHPLSIAANQRVRDLKLPQECILVAIIRQSDLILPRGDTVLLPADEILALVHSDDLQQVSDLLGH